MKTKARKTFVQLAQEFSRMVGLVKQIPGFKIKQELVRDASDAATVAEDGTKDIRAAELLIEGALVGIRLTSEVYLNNEIKRAEQIVDRYVSVNELDGDLSEQVRGSVRSARNAFRRFTVSDGEPRWTAFDNLILAYDQLITDWDGVLDEQERRVERAAALEEQRRNEAQRLIITEAARAIRVSLVAGAA